MINEKIELFDMVTNSDLKDGGLILLAGRPGIGKTKTCVELIKSYKDKYDYLYLDLSVSGTEFWEKENINFNTGFLSSLEIVKGIEKFTKKEKSKFVIIDYLQVVEDNRDWFFRKLVEFCCDKKLVIIITSLMPEIIEKRKNHLPKKRDFSFVGNIMKFCKKIVYVNRPAIYVKNYGETEEELEYFICKND